MIMNQKPIIKFTLSPIDKIQFGALVNYLSYKFILTNNPVPISMIPQIILNKTQNRYDISMFSSDPNINEIESGIKTFMDNLLIYYNFKGVQLEIIYT